MYILRACTFPNTRIHPTTILTPGLPASRKRVRKQNVWPTPFVPFSFLIFFLCSMKQTATPLHVRFCHHSHQIVQLLERECGVVRKKEAAFPDHQKTEKRSKDLGTPFLLLPTCSPPILGLFVVAVREHLSNAKP
ncbi:hypothetical protein QBC44DRAFT_113977 [Cladorrhinum sp. PSN332]|nr:hypothetical protein QBC44DRAFT_113977 [Cladorrhinum sp. PSN332]